jgi:hypothetical protein
MDLVRDDAQQAVLMALKATKTGDKVLRKQIIASLRSYDFRVHRLD